MAAGYESVTNENFKESEVPEKANAEPPQEPEPQDREEPWPDLMVTRAYKSARKLPKGRCTR